MWPPGLTSRQLASAVLGPRPGTCISTHTSGDSGVRGTPILRDNLTTHFQTPFLPSTPAWSNLSPLLCSKSDSSLWSHAYASELCYFVCLRWIPFSSPLLALSSTWQVSTHCSRPPGNVPFPTVFLCALPALPLLLVLYPITDKMCACACTHVLMSSYQVPVSALNNPGGSIHMNNYCMLMLKDCWQIIVKCLEKRVALSEWHNIPFGYRGSIFFSDSESFTGSISLTWDV